MGLAEALASPIPLLRSMTVRLFAMMRRSIQNIRTLVGALLVLLVAAAPAHAGVAIPDYDDARYWSQAASARPAGAADASDLVDVDVFYIHPTTTSEQGLLNHDPLEPKVMAWTDESAIARQASAFAACCRIFAPRYRAATSQALFSENREKAFALAYADIERAFDHYITHENGGRPFILAGHSQGGAHVATLLEKQIEATPLKDRMVAAYVVGINLSEGDFGTRFPTLRPCATALQAGCVVQWNAVLAGTDLPPVRAAFEKDWRARTGSADGARILCVNPVSFAADKPLTLSAEARGAVPGKPGAGPMAAIRSGAVAARCDDGLLTVWIAPGLDLAPLPGGSMHFHDIGLFWADISANALARARKFCADYSPVGQPVPQQGIRSSACNAPTAI